MTSITKADVFRYYQQNRGIDLTDLMQRFLKKEMDISIENVKPEMESAFLKEVSKLVQKLKWIIQKNQSAKSMRSLEEAVFLSADDCNLLVKLSNNSSPRENDDFDDPVFDESFRENEIMSSTDQNYTLFGDLRNQGQRVIRTKELVTKLNEWVQRERFPFERLIGFIGYSHCYLKNKKLASIFKNIWKGEEIELKNEVPLETAICLKENAMISKRHYTDIRLTLKPFVILPSYNEVARHLHEIVPELRSINDGVMAKVVDVARSTVVRLPDDVVDILKAKVMKNSSITFKANFSCGIDGSGGFPVYNNKSYLSSSSNTSHLISVGMSLTSIELDDDSRATVYKVDKACAFKNQRPIALIPGKETRDTIKDVIAAIDIGIYQGRENQNLFDFGSFKARFKIDIKLCQMDTKMIKMISGLTGAYFTACSVSEADARIVRNVSNGFQIDRDMTNLDQLYNELKVMKPNGKEFIPKSIGDYAKRQGLCMPPLTKNDICGNITVLHSYLNSLSFFEKILYCINAGVLKMSSQFKPIKLSAKETKKINEAKERLKSRAKRSPLFVRIDTHDSLSSSGTSDTGNIARKFFSQAARNAVLNLIEGEGEDDIANRSKIKDLLQRFSIILRILSSKSVKILYLPFQTFCTETYLMVLTYFNWVHIPGSIHRLLGHSAERIHSNRNYGLGNLSEEGLESTNKMVRRFRQHGARNQGIKECLIDVYCHWWAQSDGKIQSASRTYQCQTCSDFRHSKKSKRVLETPNTTDFNANDDDTIFESLTLY